MIFLLTHRAYYRAMRPTDVPSCSGCGACCGVFGVPVKAEESASLEPWTCDQRDEGPRYGTVDFIASIGGAGLGVKAKHKTARLCDGENTGRCSKLTGHVGEDAACSIYEYRPIDCRTFEPGGWNCLACRDSRGLDVPGWFKRAHARVEALLRKPAAEIARSAA